MLLHAMTPLLCTAALQLVIKALPLMIGWFALNLPSGLGLYYLSNTVLTTGQQLFLRKYSGAHGGCCPYTLSPLCCTAGTSPSPVHDLAWQGHREVPQGWHVRSRCRGVSCPDAMAPAHAAA